MTVVGALEDIADGGVVKVDVDGVPVAVVRVGDDVYAVADTCSHAEVSLSGGEVWCDELEIECPKHGSTFRLDTGEPTVLPATRPVEVFDVTIVDGQVDVSRRTEETTA
jgi:3-phenylpropionate/trans-cinnamate dioxygenase ferredoxin subunit